MPEDLALEGNDADNAYDSRECNDFLIVGSGFLWCHRPVATACRSGGLSVDDRRIVRGSRTGFRASQSHPSLTVLCPIGRMWSTDDVARRRLTLTFCGAASKILPMNRGLPACED